jgi:hypothetical protein
MSAGSAERSFPMATAPEIVHIITVKIKTLIARSNFIAMGKRVAVKVN